MKITLPKSVHLSFAFGYWSIERMHAVLSR